MPVPNLLRKILDGLLTEEFNEFKWFLTQNVLENCDPIPKSHLEDASRIKVVDKLLQSYGEEMAVRLSAEVLKEMKMNQAREELMSLYTAGENDTKAQLSDFRIAAF